MNEQQQSQKIKSEYELKREQKLAEQKRRERNRVVKRALKIGTVIALVGGSIGFLGWWGVGTMNKQRAAQIGASSEKALAPDFTLPSTTSGAITLSDFRGKKNVLLYFHEGLSCQPCWEQIPELERALPEFEKMNVVLLSVALDPVEQWKDTIDQYRIKTPILSYQDSNTEQTYRLLPYSMGMGRRAGHTFVLIDTHGAIKWRKDYWPSRGHMVAGGTMFVESKYIVQAVKENLGL